MMRKVFQLLLVVWLVGGVWLAMPAPAKVKAQTTNPCRFNLKIFEYRVLEDMGDGLFDGRMEVKVIFSISNDQLVIDRYDPLEETVKLDVRQRRELDDFIFSMPATDTITIEVLAIEVDAFPAIFGVDIDTALVGLGNAIGSAGSIGQFLDGVIESGVSTLRDAIASDDLITDDTHYLYADEWWNVGELQTYTTDDGDFEFTYLVSLSNCEAPPGA